LRVAVAEAALPDSAPVFPGGVKPDVAVEVSPATNAAGIEAELENGVAPLVAESERLKMNEAALVAGRNPDLEALQERRREGRKESGSRARRGFATGAGFHHDDHALREKARPRSALAGGSRWACFTIKRHSARANSAASGCAIDRGRFTGVRSVCAPAPARCCHAFA
jgi:hypothetical protein